MKTLFKDLVHHHLDRLTVSAGGVVAATTMIDIEVFMRVILLVLSIVFVTLGIIIRIRKASEDDEL